MRKVDFLNIWSRVFKIRSRWNLYWYWFQRSDENKLEWLNEFSHSPHKKYMKMSNFRRAILENTNDNCSNCISKPLSSMNVQRTWNIFNFRSVGVSTKNYSKLNFFIYRSVTFRNGIEQQALKKNWSFHMTYLQQLKLVAQTFRTEHL